MKGYRATDRRVIGMAGADVETLLQNLVTNDVTRAARCRAVYAALLTPQGKYLFDFFVLRGGDGGWLIDTAADRAEALAQRLKMYCLRRDARIIGDAGLAVTLVWGGDADARPAPQGDAAVPDPRAQALGWRVYAPAEQDILADLGARPAAPGDYAALRVAHQVPETGVELVPDETYILEAGFEQLSGVDFRKGCYVGQEVTARMKHKAALKKRLVQVAIEGAAAPGTPVTADGKPAGTLFTQAGDQALAHLRLDRATGEMRAGAARLTYRP